MENLKVTIVPRETSEGYTFAEVLYEWQEGGQVRNALTRYWWPVDTSAHQVEAERQAFLTRRKQREHQWGGENGL